jgi:hypothetical protein
MIYGLVGEGLAVMEIVTLFAALLFANDYRPDGVFELGREGADLDRSDQAAAILEITMSSYVRPRETAAP